MSLILIPKFVYFQRGRNNEHACPGAQVQQFTKVIINEDASKGAKKKKKKDNTLFSSSSTRKCRYYTRHFIPGRITSCSELCNIFLPILKGPIQL